MTSRSHSTRGGAGTALSSRRGEHRPRARRAISLAETVVSIVLVGGVLVVALNTAGSAVAARLHIGKRAQAELLAHDLMAEILQQDYEEPDDPPVFGREAGENSATRIDYDDVDDYLGWDSTPLVREDGTQIPGTVNWGRSVAVDYADPNDPSQMVGSESGIKRITVTVTHNDVVAASITAIRTAARDSL